MLIGFGRRLLGALGIATVTGAALAPQAAEARNAPALWSVSDADTTVYLFGTIHLLPPDYHWQTAAFERAKAKSQTLVIETIIDPAHPQTYLNAIHQLGFGVGLPPITERVPAAKRPALLAAIAKTGIAQPQFDQMKTWYAGVLLLQSQLREIGLDATEGPETVLREQFAAAGKPVNQLETNYEQFSFFNGLPEAAQRQILEGSIETPDMVRKEFNPMLSAWSIGDVKGIGVSFNRDFSGSPELRKVLLKQRNANWARWIEQRMQKPGALMIAVGAGHLAGEDSVINLLKHDGLHVHRIQ